MMQLNIYQIDAFTNQVFGGNPACVVPLQQWLPDQTMLQIAQENAVAETAFFVELADGSYHLRWFTPTIEMDLCGHATLATAHCIKTILGNNSPTLTFNTLSGQLLVEVASDQYTLNFPSWTAQPTTLPPALANAFNKAPIAVYMNRDYLLVYEQENDLQNMVIDRTHLDTLQLGTGGIIVTAPGTTADFVSRFFVPGASPLEDWVTGSAHCTLIPYWAKKLGKTELLAHQISARKGILHCTYLNERVLIGGNAVTYLKGEISL